MILNEKLRDKEAITVANFWAITHGPVK